MLRFLADENFDNRILRGLRLWVPDVDVVRAQDVGLASYSDEEVLTWAAGESRIVITHDKKTMIKFAVERINRGEPMPGLIVARRELGIRQALGDLAILVQCGIEEDFKSQVMELPV